MIDHIPAILKLLIFLFIHILIPIAGWKVYRRLLRKMHNEAVPCVPKRALLAIFLIYGILLMEILTGLFWYWSGMSSLGLGFLVFAAPIICIIIAIKQEDKVSLSKYHLFVHHMAIIYLPIEGLAILVAGVMAFINR